MSGVTKEGQKTQEQELWRNKTQWTETGNKQDYEGSKAEGLEQGREQATRMWRGDRTGTEETN